MWADVRRKHDIEALPRAVCAYRKGHPVRRQARTTDGSVCRTCKVILKEGVLNRFGGAACVERAER
jgi:hypothetical protein